MCWFCTQYLLSWGGWCLCVKRCMKEPDMMTCWTLLGKGPNWVVRVSNSAVCTFAAVETEWLVVWCYTSTSNTYPSNFPWHLEEWVLLWDFWIPIFNVCAGMGDFTSIWFHVFYAHIVQSCKYKTSMVSVVLLVLLQSWCFFCEASRGSVQPSFSSCVWLMCSYAQPFCGRNVSWLKADRQESGWDMVQLCSMLCLSRKEGSFSSSSDSLKYHPKPHMILVL